MKIYLLFLGWLVIFINYHRKVLSKISIKSIGNTKLKEVNMIRQLNVIYQLIRLRMERAMAPHSSTLAWKIPWTEEPGELQSMGLPRVGQDSATSLSLFMHQRRKWQPTPVFLSGESQGWGSLVGCRLWGRTELDMTEVTQQQQQQGYVSGQEIVK